MALVRHVTRALGRTALAALAAGLFATAVPAGPGARAADEAIVIGDLNSYSRLPAFSEPYRKGWQLALAEINGSGGVLGRELAVESRDDGGAPGAAATAANDLIVREESVMLIGTLLSHVGLAVGDLANQKGIPFLAAEPLSDALVWSQGNPMTFRLRPGTYVQSAMLAEWAAQLPARRWVTIAPNYEYGQSAVRDFKALLKEKRPDVEFVGEQWPPLFKLDAGPSVQALLEAEPEAIFNVTFGADLVAFVREGDLRGLFDGRAVVSLLTGEPEWMLPLGKEVPSGWIVTGYPVEQLTTPAHLAFREAYLTEFDEEPRMGSVVGYVTLHAVADAIAKAGSTDAEAIAAAFRGLELETPFGPIVFRASDQQSTMGTFVGILEPTEESGTMIDWQFHDGSEYLPGPAETKELREGS